MHSVAQFKGLPAAPGFMLSFDEMPGWRNGRRYGLKIAEKPKNEISRDQMNQYLPTSQPSKFCLVRVRINTELHHLYIIGFLRSTEFFSVGLWASRPDKKGGPLSALRTFGRDLCNCFFWTRLRND